MSRSKRYFVNNCPDESEAVMMKLNEYGSTILFDSEKHLLKRNLSTLGSITKRISLFKILS
jgi:hypothetical protein